MELEIDFTPPFARIPMIAGYVYSICMCVCEYSLSHLSLYIMYVCIERESGTRDRLHPAIRAHPHGRRVRRTQRPVCNI